MFLENFGLSDVLETDLVVREGFVWGLFVLFGKFSGFGFFFRRAMSYIG